MAERSYWLDLFTAETWDEFLAGGGEVSGFSDRRWKTVERMRPGDYLLCYLTGISRFVGLLEVVQPAFRSEERIWSGAIFPARLGVRTIVKLTPETAVPVLDLRDRLSMFQNIKNPNRWSGPFRASPTKWKDADGEAVVEALLDAEKNPVVREVDPVKLAHRPKSLAGTDELVAIPDDEAEEEAAPSQVKEASKHTEIQWQLLKLGSDMGLSVWVARNDRSREWQGKGFSTLPRLRAELPHQFDQATNRIIEMIDVLWLDSNAIVAAFEIESTTSIYSGLLRMSDLLAMQPNLNIPLFLVAAEARRSKVFAEVNRPTFSKLSPPLVDVCRYIAFESLERELARVAPFVRYLKPDVLQELSESCEVEEP
jgi:hypothetical protein